MLTSIPHPEIIHLLALLRVHLREAHPIEHAAASSDFVSAANSDTIVDVPDTCTE